MSTLAIFHLGTILNIAAALGTGCERAQRALVALCERATGAALKEVHPSRTVARRGVRIAQGTKAQLPMSHRGAQLAVARRIAEAG